MSLLKLESFNSSKTDVLNVSQERVKMFLRTKHKNKSHEFGLVVLNEDTVWPDFQLPQSRQLLLDLEMAFCSPFNLEGLFSLIQNKTEVPVTELADDLPPECGPHCPCL
ncbi:hypothetical protein HPG69_012997 [Diceros bicornis minor]|uniref:Uncharacterized protein n=1 Tax=Diceros bicornis minor TaxID=77932 RepID=A0A7J7F1D7_DICBM|nr:hypothetical protein HPG69_012997 [Diceros bicornis minor]